MRRWQSAGQRDLRTVLFTDIVGSTEAAARIGDRAWAAVLARHHSLVRAALRRNDGHEEDTAGDGFFATFARPSDALAGAAEIVRDVAALGITVRVGLHAGEVEHQDGKATGITVHTAARLMAAAQPGEVLASATVRELTAGAGWSFVDRGLLELKGLTEPVRAYTLDLGSSPTVAGSGRTRAISGGPLPAILAAIGLVVVAIVGVRLVGSSAEPGPSPTPIALSSALQAGLESSAVSSPGASPSIDPLPLEVTRKELAPGLYVANEFIGEPTFMIVDPGWKVAFPNLAFARMTSPQDQLALSFIRTLASDPCAAKPGLAVGGDPEAQFLAWAKANPALKLSPSDGVIRQFGGLTATEFDVSTVAKYACTASSPTAIAIEYGGGNASITVGTRLRLEVSSWNGQLLLIGISTPSGADFGSFDALAEKVLSTIQFPP